jgi:hypothetical protein
MKFIVSLLILGTFSAQAATFMSIKERLRLHLWTQGLQERPVKVKPQHRMLPEELERALQKI